MNLSRIVVATDFTENSLPALEAAFTLARETGASLRLVHVLQLSTMADAALATIPAPASDGHEWAVEKLEELMPENLEGLDSAVEVLRGAPPTAIADYALRVGADMIVLGTHGRKGLARVFLGSTAESLLREAPCQVLVVKPKVGREHAVEEPAEEGVAG